MKKSLAICFILIQLVSFGQAPYALPKLNYAYTELESAVDSVTMRIHHSKHHQAYVNNLNKALSGTKLEALPLTDLLVNISLCSDAVRNNAGGHYNHSLFWEVLTPKKGTKPSPELAAAITSTFGHMDSLKKILNQAAATRFGSGWAWLVVTPDKKIVVSSTANQDNPIMDVAAVRGVPILGIDVWEHAYYLKYQNKRADYLGALWNIIDWDAVSKKYTEALSSPLLQKIEQDNWHELKDFYKVIIETYHPIEKGDYAPIRAKSDELYLKALLLKKSKIPASLDDIKTKASLEKILALSKEIQNAVEKNASDEQLKKKLDELHTTFHEVQNRCSIK